MVAASPGDAVLREVVAAAQSQEGRRAFAARDMVLFTVVDGRGQQAGQDMPAGATRALLEALQLPQSVRCVLVLVLVLVLVGKDGGTKLVQQNTADLRAVYAEIDGMPMRQNELKSGAR